MKRLLRTTISAFFLAASTARAAIVTVNVESFTFTPSDVTVAPGDTVRWVWLAGGHSTTSDTGIWDSLLRSAGDVFDFTFTTVGNFPYYCSVHGAPGGVGMSAIIRVGTPPTPTPTPTITPTPTVTATFATTTPTTSGRFYSVTPCRVADTRNPAGPYGGPPLSAGAERTFTIMGQCGIPSGAKAVAFNLTVTGPTAPGHVVLYPGGTPLPPVSNINFGAGQTRANNAIVSLGAGGTLAAVSGQLSGTVHIILDVVGYIE